MATSGLLSPTRTMNRECERKRNRHKTDFQSNHLFHFKKIFLVCQLLIKEEWESKKIFEICSRRVIWISFCVTFGYLEPLFIDHLRSDSRMVSKKITEVQQLIHSIFVSCFAGTVLKALVRQKSFICWGREGHFIQAPGLILYMMDCDKVHCKCGWFWMARRQFWWAAVCSQWAKCPAVQYIKAIAVQYTIYNVLLCIAVGRGGPGQLWSSKLGPSFNWPSLRRS